LASMGARLLADRHQDDAQLFNAFGLLRAA
jgi:hypothetical protein